MCCPNRAEAEEKLAELFGDEAVVQLKSSNWKDRLTSMDSMLEHVNGAMKGPAMDTNTSAIIQGLAFLPGWSEKNFQVWLLLPSWCLYVKPLMT